MISGPLQAAEVLQFPNQTHTEALQTPGEAITVLWNLGTPQSIHSPNASHPGYDPFPTQIHLFISHTL